jgi:uncharacterized circularly permuted ATP-grasp superfamily protein
MVQTLAKKMRSMKNHMENLARVMENKGAHSLNKCNSEISYILMQETVTFSSRPQQHGELAIQLLEVF